MTTILAKKPILRTILLLLALALVITLAIIFRPKPPLYALADLARQDAPDRPLLTTTIISASTDTVGTNIVYSTGSNLDEALEKTITKITAHADFSTYTHFRLDIAYGPEATSPDTLVATLPDIGSYTYFATTTSARQISTKTPTLTPEQVREVIAKASLFLSNQVQSDGKFLYGFDLRTSEPSADYSTAAHAAAISTLLKSYQAIGDPQLLAKAELALDFLIGFVVISNEHPDRAYVENATATAIDLSSTSLTAIALADYQDITGSTEHTELLRYLANGIESTYRIQATCTFYAHQLALDLTPTSEPTAPYYDTQATYAIARAAKILANKTLLSAVARNLDQMGEGVNFATEALYWLAQAITAYEFAGGESGKYPIPTLESRTPEQIYTDFTEPWIAMFSATPHLALHSFTDRDAYATIAFHQSALTELLSLQKTL